MTEGESISREIARGRGLHHYFTGKPCKYGHVAERLLANGDCVICAKAKAARWKKTTKGKTYQEQYRHTPKMRENRRQYDHLRYLARKRPERPDLP